MGIKTFSVANPKLPQGPPSIEHPLTSPTSVALGRKGALGPWTLVSPTYNTFSDYEPREYLFLSVLIHEDAFPPPSPAGRAQFYMKTYSENEGMLPQLASAGILRDTGRTMKQGFATVPLCEVILEEGELARCCAGCEKWEVIDGQRFERCSRCKVEYYHSQEVCLAFTSTQGYDRRTYT